MSSHDRREAGDRQTGQNEGRPLLPDSADPGLSAAAPALAALEMAEPNTAVAAPRATLAEGVLAYLRRIEPRAIELSTRWFEWAARVAIFIIYFWFGFLKLINLSPATPLATALVKRTIGMQ